jgi:hypothetical protein
VDGVERFPAVQWRMLNVAKMKPDAMRHELSRLDKVFAQ